MPINQPNDGALDTPKTGENAALMFTDKPFDNPSRLFATRLSFFTAGGCSHVVVQHGRPFWERGAGWKAALGRLLHLQLPHVHNLHILLWMSISIYPFMVLHPVKLLPASLRMPAALRLKSLIGAGTVQTGHGNFVHP